MMWFQKLLTGTKNEKGLTLVELLVGVAMFGVIGGTLAVSMTGMLRSLGRETRLAAASEGAALAMSVLTSELKAAAHASPYLVGTDSTVVSCRTTVQVTPTKVEFLISHDDGNSVNGLRSVKVGYLFDEATKTLYRGEIAGSSVVSCVNPAGDPTVAALRNPIAEKIIQVDFDGDGTLDPVFELDNTNLTITFGTEVVGERGAMLTQRMQSIVDIRNTRNS